MMRIKARKCRDCGEKSWITIMGTVRCRICGAVPRGGPTYVVEVEA